MRTKNIYLIIPLSFILLFNSNLKAQTPDGTGAWYMYFWNTSFKESAFGLQGDIQHRNWNIGGDLEQLLLRGGLTYKPTDWDVKFTLGYGNITKGTFGTDISKVYENRIYQEALYPYKLGNRIKLTHRFRYEQRWNHNDDFRTRYRYNIFINFHIYTFKKTSKGPADTQPRLNDEQINHFSKTKTLYLSFYNELFMNGQKDIGNGNTVEFFDLNRTYIALGYSLKENLKVQAGMMKQTNNAYSKSQIQLSLHHKL